MQNLTKIPFAIQTSTGAIVSIDDVERGLRCGCHCPSCLGRLIANQGAKNVHHFSHHDASSEQCEYAFATSVRLMLQAQFPGVTGLNTPAHHRQFEGTHIPVAEARQGIPVRHVPQESSQSVPAGLFQLVDHTDYHLALHLPPAQEPDGGDTPVWLEAFTEAHPKWGVLSVRYNSFRRHLYDRTRPPGIDTVQWLLTLLMQEVDCLGWLYHPREQAALAKWQVLAEQRMLEHEEWQHKQAELLQSRQEELERRPVSRAARMKLVYADSHRFHQAWLEEDRRKRQAAQQPEQASALGPGFCRHCHLATPRLDQAGFCDRHNCIDSRQQRLGSTGPSGSALAVRRTSYAQARNRPLPTAHVPPARTEWREPAKQSTDGLLCPHCGGKMGKGVRGWWCEHCKQEA